MPSSLTDLIRADHREMERLFRVVEDREQRRLAAPVLVSLLAAHSRAEESEVYPVLRDDPDTSDALAHSQEEHVEADQLAATLVDTEVTDESFDATLRALVKSVAHHLEEEEETVLPALDRLPTARREQLATAFLKVRAHHLMSGSMALTRDDLETQARNQGVSGTSSMTKQELANRLG